MVSANHLILKRGSRKNQISPDFPALVLVDALVLHWLYQMRCPNSLLLKVEKQLARYEAKPQRWLVALSPGPVRIPAVARAKKRKLEGKKTICLK